jgi:porin
MEASISKPFCALFATLCGALALPLATHAEEAPDYAGATLSSDWGGSRNAAWQRGWALDAALKVDTLRNRGGISSGSRSMTNLDLRAKADLGKLTGWDDATAYLHVLDNRGAGVNVRHTGSLMGVSNIEVPVPTTRIFHAWLQQNFFDEQFSLLAGLYPIDAEFFTMDSASVLVHPTFGAPADLALTRGPSIFNNSAFGLRAKWQSADRTRYLMGAVLDGTPNDPDHPKRTAIKFNKGDGIFSIAELGWMPLEYGHVFEPTDPAGGLKTPELVAHEKYGGLSKYAIGFWRYSTQVPDQLSADNNRPSQGAYLLAERTLLSLGEAGRDLTVFARHSRSDGDSISLDRILNLGVRLRSPLASRPDDVLVIGWTQSRLSAKYRTAQSAAGSDTAAHEEALEITWRAAITPYFFLQPVAQSIHHPGGASNTPRANIIGLRVEIAL